MKRMTPGQTFGDTRWLKKGWLSMSYSLALGTAKVDITPPKSVPLAGFSWRQGGFYKVTRRLYAKIFVFEQKSPAADAPKRALLVSADLICWGTDRMPMLRRNILEQYGFADDEIIMHATHNHSGPQTSQRISPAVGACDPEYVQWLERELLEGIGKALDNLEPVDVRRGIGSCGFNVNRRKLVNGEIRGEPNENGPVDREVNVVAFYRRDGSPKAVLAHYTCHPTTTDANEISSEFCGVATGKIESIFGNRTLCAYLQGCTGDVRPNLVRDGKFYRGTDEHVCRLGHTLADEIADVLGRPMTDVKPAPLLTRRLVVPLKLQKPGEQVPFEMTLLRLADDLGFVAMNGEVVVEYGLLVKKKYKGKVIPLAYSNGMLGYIPTERQVHEGGYEGRVRSFAGNGNRHRFPETAG
jgi:hypothetical protein